MNIGEMEVASIVFEQLPVGGVSTGNDTVYILTEGPRQSRWDWADLYPARPVKLVSGFHAEDTWTDSRWFLFANVDCFDPNVFIVRAKSFETAYDVFCDEFAKQAGLLVDESDAADYPEDDRNYNNNGEHINTEGVQGYELSFVAAFNY